MIALLLLGCDVPVVYIDSPAEAAQIPLGQPVDLSAFAARPEGVLEGVETVVLLDGIEQFHCGAGGSDSCASASEYSNGRLGLTVPVADAGDHRLEVTSRLWRDDVGADFRDSSIVHFQVVDSESVDLTEPADPLAETCLPEDQDAASVSAVALADAVLELDLTYLGSDVADHTLSLCWDPDAQVADLVFQLGHDVAEDAGDSLVNDTLRVDVTAPLQAFLGASPDATQVQVLIQVPDGSGGYTDGEIYALSL